MKKRILSLLMAAITILQLFSTFTLPTLAEDGATISVEEMVVGKRYRAVIKTEAERGDLYMGVFGISDGAPMAYSYVTRTTLPQELIIIKAEEFPGYVYVMNESWRSSETGNLDAYRYIEAAEIHILECLDAEPEPEPEPEPDGSLIGGEVGLITENGEAVSSLVLSKGEKLYVYTELSEKLEQKEMMSYSWQILLDRDNNRWAIIPDYIYPYAPVSEALFASVDMENGAILRCIATSNGRNYVSGELNVSIAAQTGTMAYTPMKAMQSAGYSRSNGLSGASMMSTSTGTMARAAGDTRASDEAFQIVISYTFRHDTAVEEIDGHEAANTFTVSLPAGASYKGDVTSPPVVGYKPYVSERYKDYITGGATEPTTYGGEQYYPANSISFIFLDAVLFFC